MRPHPGCDGDRVTPEKTLRRGAHAIPVSGDVLLDNLYVNMVFGRDLFEGILREFGAEGWNAYARKLRQHDIWAMYSTPEPAEADDHCMPVCLKIDLRGEDFRGSGLADLDLQVPMLDGSDFTDADLHGATLGSVSRCSFRGADLSGADFTRADISGCDFAGARLMGADFDGANYFTQRPPLNLPDECLVECSPFPAHWNPDERGEEDEVCHRLEPRRTELRSFWGA